jgi:hypothetical protein
MGARRHARLRIRAIGLAGRPEVLRSSRKFLISPGSDLQIRCLVRDRNDGVPKERVGRTAGRDNNRSGQRETKRHGRAQLTDLPRNQAAL